MNARILILGIAVVFMSAVVGWSFQTGVPDGFQPDVRGMSDPKSQVSGTVFAKKDGLIAIDLQGNDRQDQIAVIDPKTRSLATYQIDRVSGEITLKSVRKIHWDLQLDDYNGSKPTTQVIKSAVEQNLKR